MNTARLILRSRILARLPGKQAAALRSAPLLTLVGALLEHLEAAPATDTTPLDRSVGATQSAAECTDESGDGSRPIPGEAQPSVVARGRRDARRRETTQ